MSETPDYRGYRFPSDIIAHAVWLFRRFTLSFRNVEDLLAERGITLSYETVRQWCHTFGPQYARRIKKRQGPRGDRWFLDEVVVSIQGKRRYLWRSVDQDGDLIDVLVQKRKDTRAAKRFFRRLLRSQTEVPIEITTDKLRSSAAAKRDVMPSVAHCHDQYANNRVEVSHEPTREQERQMRGFCSDGHAQRFLSVHGQVNNLFRLGRHLLRATNHRGLRERAFETWSQVTCVQ
ncbi:MAG: putative transposase [Gammaproteobacteria bacterium]|jgi:putative transposase